MKVKGLVAGVRESSFTTKKGQKVDQWHVDFYDETCGILPCALPRQANTYAPIPGTKAMADVTGIRKTTFGNFGYELSIANVQEVFEAPAPVTTGSAYPPPSSSRPK